MKYLTRAHKGTVGYLKSQRNFEIIKTAILFLMAIGIFLIGYINLGTKKSLWTVFAILATLPACKSLVGLIMLFRFHSLLPEKASIYMEAVKNLPTLYENVLTTNEKSYFVPVLCCENNTVIAYCEKKKQDDITKLTEHLNTVLKNSGHKATVKVFENENAFLQRAREMSDKTNEETLVSTTEILTTIKAVSL